MVASDVDIKYFTNVLLVYEFACAVFAGEALDTAMLAPISSTSFMHINS